MTNGIVIMGPNGSGKTTLGKYLADLIGYKHMDVEDYFFKDSDVPYTNSRTRAEVQEMILSDINKYPKFFLTSVNGDMGGEINALYDYIVYIQVPLDIRMERVKKRSFDKFGNRILEGGDMYAAEQEFFQFVANRTMDKADKWVQGMNCPVLYVDGREPIEANAKLIKETISV